MLIQRDCPQCGGSGVISRDSRGGNDPDATEEDCFRCAGDGSIPVYCEGWNCLEFATEEVTFPCGSVEPYCARCAITAREDAGMDCEPKGFW